MGFLPLFHMTQLLWDRSQPFGETVSVSGIPEVTGMLLLLHMTQIFWNRSQHLGKKAV